MATRATPKNIWMQQMLKGRSGSMRAAAKGRRAAALKALRALPRPARRPVHPLLGMELKFLDESVITTSFVAPTDAAGGELDPAAGCVGCPAQGDGASSRDGRQYVIKNIYVTGVLRAAAQVNQTVPDDGTVLFVALVQDTQTNGAQLNSEDVYSNPSGNAITAASPLRNLAFSKRFIVHDWKRCDFSNANMSWDGTNIEQSGFSVPFELSFRGAVKVNCSSTTASVTQVQDNSFHVVGFCSSTSLAPTI